jgi:hypothetical protein
MAGAKKTTAGLTAGEQTSGILTVPTTVAPSLAPPAKAQADHPTRAATARHSEIDFRCTATVDPPRRLKARRVLSQFPNKLVEIESQ